MNIVWLSWKDMQHPEAGGAERVTHEMLSRLAADGHTVSLLTSQPGNLPTRETYHGYHIVRAGGRLGVYWQAFRTFRKHYRSTTDVVIEEINTLPFFSLLYTRGTRRFLFIHQLARQIWFYQLGFPFSVVGYVAEPLYLWLLRGQQVITVSNSTKQDLVRYGYAPNRIDIISEGITLEPIKSLDALPKYNRPTLLSMGSIRPMKRTLDQIKAFELAAQHVPDLRLLIVGDSSTAYGQSVLRYIAESPQAHNITYFGRVDESTKRRIMQRSHLLLATSVREGWGLVVTESASQGTPTVAYNVHGLRDSVKHAKTGLLTAPNPQSLADSIVHTLETERRYAILRKHAYTWSKTITFEKAYCDFKKTTGIKAS